MAVTLNADYMREVGLQYLAPPVIRLFLQHVRETLELRVGTVLAAKLSARELAEFERLSARDDDAGRLWLEQAVPDYKAVIAHEHRALKQVIASLAPAILAEEVRLRAGEAP